MAKIFTCTLYSVGPPDRKIVSVRTYSGLFKTKIQFAQCRLKQFCSRIFRYSVEGWEDLLLQSDQDF